MPQTRGLQFTARIGEYSPDIFSVVSFALTQGLSQLFHGRLQLASTDPGVRAEDLLEQPVDLVIWQDGEPVRRPTGMVSGGVRQPGVFRFAIQERVRAASVVMKDYSFRNPAYALMPFVTMSAL